MINNAVYSKACRCAVYIIMLASGLTTYADASAVYKWISPSGVVSYGSFPHSGAKHVVIISGVRSSDTTTAIPQSASNPIAKTHTRGKGISHSEYLVKLKADQSLARNALIQAIHSYKRALSVRTGNERNYATYLTHLRSMRNNVKMAKIRLDIIQKDILEAEHGHPPAVNP